MSYSIDLPKEVASRIQATLPRPCYRAFVEKVDELAEDPYLGKRVPAGLLEGLMCYSFRVNCLPATFDLSLFYRLDPDKKRLAIVDFSNNSAGFADLDRLL